MTNKSLKATDVDPLGQMDPDIYECEANLHKFEIFLIIASRADIFTSNVGGQTLR
jgi:hypothetical protein